MNPFDNVVGLKPVDQKAKVWVNSLPSVPNDIVFSLMEPVDYLPQGGTASEDSREIWKNIKANAHDQLLLDLESFLSEKGIFRAQLATSLPMRYSNQLSNSGDIHEVQFQAPYLRYTELRLKELHLRLSSPGTVTIRALDNATGRELHTLTTEPLDGLQTLPLDWTFSNERGLDISVTVAAAATLLGFEAGAPYISDVGYNQLRIFRKTNQSQNVAIVHIEPVFDFGGSVNSLVKTNLTALETTFLYICSAWVLRHLLASYNFNVNTNTNRLVVEANLADYEKDYQRFLKRSGLVLNKQLEGTYVFDVNPTEVGGIHNVSYV